MKNFAKGVAIMSALLIALPIISMAVGKLMPPQSVPTVATPQNPDFSEISTVKIYSEQIGEIVELPLNDFLVRAVMASVKPSFEPEIIKAQAVLMRTYILNRHESEKASPTKELLGCDIGTDPEKYVRLLTDAEGKILYGEEYPEFKSLVMQCVLQTAGEYAFYGGKPIVAAYFLASGGQTESAATVLGEEIPYLQSVLSPYDDDFTTEAVYTKDELFARISTKCSANLLGEPQSWVTLSSVSPSGYVKEVTLGDSLKVSGSELSRWLNLPSARFKMSYIAEFERFNFTVYGSGHLVGLSILGGNEMAKQGSTYAEILEFYLQGIEIVEK